MGCGGLRRDREGRIGGDILEMARELLGLPAFQEFWQRVLGRQRVEGARRVTARPHHGAPPFADAGDHAARAQELMPAGTSDDLPVPLAPSTKRAFSRTPRSRY